MSAVSIPPSMTMPYRGTFLTVCPVVEINATTGEPSATRSFLCFVMRQEGSSTWKEIVPPGGGPGSVILLSPADPRWITQPVGVTYKSAKEALEEGVAWVDLNLFGQP
jgi:hypothetical protein